MDLVTLELTIPSDWTPGTKLIWLAPSGKRIQIDVPPNAAPGTDIDFEVPRAILDDPAKAALRAEYAKPSVAPWLEARRGKLDATEKYSLAAVREKVAVAAPAVGAGVDKAAYSAWEAAVVAAFYDASHRRTPLKPTDGAPSLLTKRKVILVAVADGVAEAVADGATDGLPAHQHVQLWHVGKQKADGVRFGFAEADALFKHPACDVGGLTNLRQKAGTPAAFVGTPRPLVLLSATASPARDATAADLVAEWSSLAPAAFTPPKVSDVSAFLASVEAAHAATGPVTLRFHALPPEHRVVVTPADVVAATGRYLVRVFDGGSGAPHAKASDGAGLYCGVSATFVTPNLSIENLESEYVEETSRPPTPAEASGGAAAGGDLASWKEGAARPSLMVDESEEVEVGLASPEGARWR